MKRKLIKQGAGGLTLCIPKKWTEKANLKAGDEINLTEDENSLKIFPGEKKIEPKIINFRLKDTF